MNSKQAEALGHWTLALACVAGACAAVYFMPLFAVGAALGFSVAILKDRIKKHDESLARCVERRHN